MAIATSQARDPAILDVVERRAAGWPAPRGFHARMARLVRKGGLTRELEAFERDFLARYGAAPAPEQLWTAALFLERRARR
ncbi:MAG: hypothetical protein JOZ27_09610 [Caulobacteraceae bacterium]|nr:hypothetical protein [Caulobacteraceae bacterium]